MTDPFQTPPRRLPPDARIVRPEEQPQRYDLATFSAARQTAWAGNRPVAVPRPAPGPSFTGMVRELVETILPAVLIALLIHLFLAQATRVEGYSMEPTLYGHQRLVIEKLSYRLHEPQRGDIIVIHVPGYGSEMLIKRIVGLPGDTVSVQNGQVFLNGQAMQEPYLRSIMRGTYPTTRVPDNSVFVMGDNRNNSNDSRSFGPIPINDIVGKAWLRYWPLSDFGIVH